MSLTVGIGLWAIDKPEIVQHKRQLYGLFGAKTTVIGRCQLAGPKSCWAIPSALWCKHALRLSEPNTGIPSRNERNLSLHTHCKHDERSKTPHCWIVDQPLALARRVGPDWPITFMGDVHVIVRPGNGPWQALDRLAPLVDLCSLSFSRTPRKRDDRCRRTKASHVLWFSKVSSGICWLNVELHTDRFTPHQRHTRHADGFADRDERSAS
jgi:hypothetical protein